VTETEQELQQRIDLALHLINKVLPGAIQKDATAMVLMCETLQVILTLPADRTVSLLEFMNVIAQTLR